MEVRDRVSMPLWDSGSAPGWLFRNPIGDGLSVFSPGEMKTFVDTNMMLSSQLPREYVFEINEIRAEPILGCDREDLKAVTLQLVIGSKNYTQVPASEAACRLSVGEISRGLLLPGMAFGHVVRPSLVIAGGQNFAVQMFCAKRSRVFVRVSLCGLLARPVA